MCMRLLLIVLCLLTAHRVSTKMPPLNLPRDVDDVSSHQISKLTSESNSVPDGVINMDSLQYIVNYLHEYIEDIRRDEEGELTTYKRATSNNRGRRDVSEEQQRLPSTPEHDSTGGCQLGNHFVGGYMPYMVGQYCFMCPGGPVGPRGPPGVQGYPGMDARDISLNPSGNNRLRPSSNGQTTKGDAQPRTSVNTGGAVYTRWGRADCPESSVLIYTGIAGGSHYNVHGGGSNYLCLPGEPIYNAPLAGSQGTNVYASEYQVNGYPPMSQLHDSDVPCAVCQAVSRPSLIVIPARNVCSSPQWTKEYSGYLMTGHHSDNGRFEFVCMDQEAQAIDRTAADTNGALFYVAEGTCGSSGSGLPCPPYVGGYELTCAVCTM